MLWIERGSIMEKYTSQQPQTFKMKLENFWFYYKWYILAAILIICMAVVSIHSCANKKSIDMYVLYMVNGAYSTQANEQLALKLENYVDDIDGDGEKRVQIITISFSDVLDRNDMAQESALTRLVGQISAGPALFYVFDDANYKALKEAEVKILDEIDMTLSAAEADRFNATVHGFFDDIPEFENEENLYFGVRVSDGITENDTRYSQVKQSRDTLGKIIQEYI